MLTCWAGKMRSSLAFRGLPVGHPHLLHLHVQPKSRTGLFLASPLQPLPHFSLSPHAAPRNSHAGLEPLSPPALPAGLVMAMCTKLLSGRGTGRRQGSPWGARGLMDLLPMAAAATPALARRETGAAQALRPCGVRGGSVGGDEQRESKVLGCSPSPATPHGSGKAFVHCSCLPTRPG